MEYDKFHQRYLINKDWDWQKAFPRIGVANMQLESLIEGKPEMS